MPPTNRTLTEDIGGYVQGLFGSDPYRLNAGIRYNSVYGSTVNPRILAVYKFSDRAAIKLLYGEAFQEPAPQLLWGGWSGRLAVKP